MIIYQPYTYHIAWTEQDLHYYGVRYAQDCNPNDFWNTYYTSSSVVSQAREELGEPDIIEIRRTFADSDSAIDWEHKVLRRLRVMENDRWANRSIATAPRWSEKSREAHLAGVRGRKYSDEGKAALAERSKREWSEDRLQKMLDGRTEEGVERIREFQTGRTRSQKCKDNARAMRLAEWADEEKAAARKKAISDKIKAKWADPEYRAKMMARRKKKS